MVALYKILRQEGVPAAEALLIVKGLRTMGARIVDPLTGNPI